MRRKVLLISIAVVIALMLAGVFTINTLFNMLFTQEFRMSSDEDNKGGRPGEGISNDVTVPGQDTEKGEQDLPSEGTDSEKRIDEGKKGTDNSDKKAPSVKGQKADSDSSGKNLVVDEKKIKEIEKKVSLADKTKALSILVKSLSREDMGTLYQLARGGVTDEERKQAMSLLREKLTPEQKQAIKDLYSKYEGLLEE